MEEINKLIEQEIERQVQSKLNKFIEVVSKTYGIPMNVLLRDMKGMSEEKSPVCQQCMGSTAAGKRCKFFATANGYCKKHHNQYKPPRVIAAITPIKQERSPQKRTSSNDMLIKI